MKRIGKKSKVPHQRCRGIGRHLLMALNSSDQICAGASELVSSVAVTAGAVILGLLLQALPAVALPQGAVVVGGSARIAQPNAATMNITQNSTKAIINWQGYNIGAGQAVRYIQPGAGSIALNRVTGQSPSTILGQLSGNGQVWLINPSGVIIGPGASVRTAGFLASTHPIADNDFMAGTYHFTNPSGSLSSIVNQGNITVDSGGYVVLAAPSVTNSGKILANLGKVHLASGDEITLNFAGNDLINLVVNKAAASEALGVENAGTITADGGQVVLSAKVAGDLLKKVVNNSGIIEARSISEQNGVIVLDGGDSGSTANSGTLDVSGKSAGETGGTVKVLGDKVGLCAGSSIDASGDAGGGTVLVGGNFHGAGPEKNAYSTSIDFGTSIVADARTSGDGGRIAVWSDGPTHVAGIITARGGSQSGNGGFVETSGRQLTVARSTMVTTLAPAGYPGTWLLDPSDYIISSSDPNATISGADLTNSLNTSNIEITSSAGAHGGTHGDVIVDDQVGGGIYPWTAATTLTLSAYRNVTFTMKGGIDASGGSGNVILRADNTGTRTGTIDVSSCAGGHCITLGGAGRAEFYYNPSTYNALTDYSTSVSGGTTGSHALVFISANNKTYDGSNAATMSFIGDPTGGGANAVTLNSGTATFGDRNAGNGKTVTYSSYSLTGVDAANFSLYDKSGVTTATINPLAVTLTAPSVSKTYDGGTTYTTTAGNLTTLSGSLVGGDTVTAATVGYANRSAGIGNRTVTLDSATISDGNGGGNYTVTLAGNTTSTINPAALTITAQPATKTYDGGVSAAVNALLTVGAIQTGDTAPAWTQTYDNKDAGSGKTLTPDGLKVNDGNSGNNYAYIYVPVANGEINRLGSVTWTGAGDGSHWSDAKNWAGGAIPDKANVAQVNIPSGASVTFDNNVPKLAGSVQIDSLSSLGNLSVVDNTLSVADSLSTHGYNQTGGTVNAGTTPATVNVKGNNAFSQSGGSLNVTGSADLQVVGGIQLGSSSFSGNLTIQSFGAITQSGPVTVAGTTTLTAGANTITLDNANDFGGAVGVASGKNVTLHDVNALDLGASTVSGNLAVTAGGSVTQSGALTVTGDTTVTIATGTSKDILLASQANNLGGAVTFSSAHGGTIQDVGLRNTHANANLAGIPTTGIRNLEIIFNNAAIDLPATTLSGNLSVTAGGGINIIDAITAGGNVTLTATGAIDETGPGRVSAAALTTSSVGGQILNGANFMGSFNAANSGIGTIVLINTAASLSVTGIKQVDGGDIVVSNTGEIVNNGIISSSNAVTLKSSGSLTGTGTITAGQINLTAYTMGNAGQPNWLDIQTPNSVTLHTKTLVPTISGFLGGPMAWPGGDMTTDGNSLVKYNNKVVGGKLYGLYVEAQRAGVSSAVLAVNAKMMEKMMLLSNFEGFFSVAPKEWNMDIEGEAPESSQQQFQESVVPAFVIEDKK